MPQLHRLAVVSETGPTTASFTPPPPQLLLLNSSPWNTTSQLKPKAHLAVQPVAAVGAHGRPPDQESPSLKFQHLVAADIRAQKTNSELKA